MNSISLIVETFVSTQVYLFLSERALIVSLSQGICLFHQCPIYKHKTI